uniref:Uncharacterized protein n=1 Tax=Anguilla anguilla TaxID=7936 RepID=A0A0E9SQU9_ANGAN
MFSIISLNICFTRHTIIKDRTFNKVTH